MSAEIRTCAHCGAGFSRREGEKPYLFARRRCCSAQCARDASGIACKERLAAQRAAVIEDVEWIVDFDDAESTAARLGYEDAENLATVLIRWGRADLANRLRARRVAAA